MTRQFKIVSAVAVIAALAVVAPSAASAKAGFMSCQVADSAGMHVFFSEKSFAADSGDADKAFDRYLKELMGEKVSLLHSIDHAKGICNWETTRAEANKKTSQFVLNFFKQGYAPFSDDHMPDPYVP